MSLKAQSAPAEAAVSVADSDLQRRLAELTEAVSARDGFLAVAAHELRNPMTPILGQVELLLAAVKAGRCPPEQLEQRLERVQHSIHRYLRRATVLLGVSRFTGGRFRLDPEAFDLAALLHEVASEFAPAARHAGVAITLAIPEAMPVKLDRMALEQIADNLIANALKYGNRTPVEVSAEVAGDQVRIEVRDHGAGVPPHDRLRLVERFERVVGQNERQSGFGVGLWLIGQFVAAMDGTISIGDPPGGGALFIVTLPLFIQGGRG